MNFFHSTLLILTSPPASGKTFWIKSFADKVASKEVLIISPLRALADECRDRWGQELSVMTPEEWLVKKPYFPVVIFDEYHLHFYWGDTFRPLMWEVFYALSASAELTILLTATLSEMMKEEINHYQANFNDIFWIDHGNQRLKTAPVRYLKAPSKKWLETAILDDETSGIKLIFCQYRQEVHRWEKLLTQRGFRVWSCVGGEAKEMRLKMAQTTRPDFIVSTTVLSHGVNLPRLSRIYFLYSLENIDFWIQMVARGGRQGEAYQVMALENPHGIKWNSWLNSLAILWISFRMKLNSQLRQIDQCFLKDSSSTKFPTKIGI